MTLKHVKNNLILISLDTVRADVAYSGKFLAIERLRKRGVTFLNTISSVPLTPPSHATVLTGLQPVHHGIRHLFKERLRKSVPTLAQILKEKGYRTGAIVSCPGMNKWYGFSRGFDHYDDEIPRLADGSDPLQTVDVKKRGTALKRANLVVFRAIAWLNAQPKEPFFLFVHFFDAHWPYEAPEKYGGKNPYEEEIAYTDHYLGLLLDRLERDRIFDRSTIICFSDHGEDLEGWYPNDKGGEKLGHPEEVGHGCLLYEQTQKVVLIVADPALPCGECVEQQVRLVDVTPTVLDLLKIKSSGRRFDGVSLLPTIHGKDLQLIGYSETFYPEEQTKATGGKFSDAHNKVAFRLGNQHKVIGHLGSDLVEVYDLVKDPKEQHDLWQR